ncbi:MAG: glycosyltransferase family 2 protein [Planctomycetota bacterium]
MHDVAFILPCLNESRTIERCVRDCFQLAEERRCSAEVIVADNASSDRSADIAREAGARVVSVRTPGYGSAIRGGIFHADARILVIGDADGSYDFSQASELIDLVESGADLAIGSRFAGGIEPGAMPFLHRVVGNPVLSAIGRVLFGIGVEDFHCGLRAVNAESFKKIRPRTRGMEFASEMIVRARAAELDIQERPVSLRKTPPGRESKLRTWRDGWRHLRFMLLMSPESMLISPGLIMFLLGLAASITLLAGDLPLGSVALGVHSLVAAALLVVLGYEAAAIGIAAKVVAIRQQIVEPPTSRLPKWIARVETGVMLGAGIAAVGILVLAGPVVTWARRDFGSMPVEDTMRPMIAGAVAVAIGVQTMLLAVFTAMIDAAFGDESLETIPDPA